MDRFVLVGRNIGYDSTGAALMARTTSTPDPRSVVHVRGRMHDDIREVLRLRTAREIHDGAIRI